MKTGHALPVKISFVLAIGFVILGFSMEVIVGQDSKPSSAGSDEYKAVERTINNVFGWAVKKDFDLFFTTIADDSDFISVTPYKRVKFGVADVKRDTSFWADPNFKAIRHEIRDLKITFSQSGDVAWFYCVLDDINELRGEPANWENVRWTGVVEKRKGFWRVVQQHFSWAAQ